MTPEIWILAALVFLPVVVISFIALRRAWEPPEATVEPAHRPGLDLVAGESPDLMFEYLTYPFAALIPTSKAQRATLFQELRAAGYYRNTALTDYLALRNLLVLAAVFVTGMLILIFDEAEMPVIAVGGIIGALLAYSVPRLYIQARGRSRARQIERGLPTAVDLLTLALTAGLSLFAAFKRVASELRYSYPALAEEFEITSRQAELRSLEHALGQLADRVRLPEVRNLAIILAQSERLGSNATPVLLETSSSLRTTLRQRAETHANRTSFWLLFPTIGCFLIGAGILIIGPVMLDVNSKMSANLIFLKDSRKTIDKLMQFGKQKAQPQPPLAPPQ
jgi:tight adherence protein C